MSSELNRLFELKEKAEQDYNTGLMKAYSGNDLQQVLEADNYLKKEDQNSQGQKTLIYDPTRDLNGNGFKDPSYFKVNYDFLRKCSYTFPINLVITTIIDEMMKFFEPQEDIYSTGFVIKPDRALKTGKVQEFTTQERKDIDEIRNFLLECGDIGQNKMWMWDGDDFDSWGRKVLRDSLTFDQLNSEIVYNNYGWGSSNGKPSRFLATDAETIRLADNSDYFNVRHDLPYAVQLNNSIIHHDYYKPELTFGIRNHSSEQTRMGYGKSEIESMLVEISSFLNATEYNANFFNNMSIPKGLLMVDSVSDNQLNDIRQQMRAARGVGNAWRMPVLPGNKAQWVDLLKGNHEMEFGNWMDFLIKCFCGAYKIDPTNIGFTMSGGNSGATPMFEGNKSEQLKNAKDRGLYPRLKFMQNIINKWLVKPFNNKYTFYFVGLDGLTKEQELERLIKESGSFKSINEIRVHLGMEEKEWGEIPANAQVLQYLQMIQQGGEGSNQEVNEMLGDDDDYDDDKSNKNVKKGELNRFQKSIINYLEDGKKDN